MNVVRIFAFIVISLFCVSCSSNIENAATAQTTDTATREPQTNVRVSQTNSKDSSEIAGRMFFKTFVIDNGYPADAGKTANAEHQIEFTDEPDKIGVYIDGKKKADLKFETNRTKVAADFRESGGVRYFVLIVASAGQGTCGDAGFAVVKIDENLNAKISKPNENNCQGELYPIGIESVSREKDFYRQISIGDLKFNLETFDWLKAKSKK